MMRRQCALHSKGFTLIEVLVAVLVLSIGLLGIAGLQTRSLQFNGDAYYRTQAQLLATDLAERMRANWQASSTGLYFADFSAVKASDCVTDTLGSDADGIKAEMGCWLGESQRALGPGYRPTVARNADDPAYADITLGWRDRDPDTQADCENISSREWNDTSKLCFVVFRWSVLL